MQEERRDDEARVGYLAIWHTTLSERRCFAHASQRSFRAPYATPRSPPEAPNSGTKGSAQPPATQKRSAVCAGAGGEGGREVLSVLTCFFLVPNEVRDPCQTDEFVGWVGFPHFVRDNDITNHRPQPEAATLQSPDPCTAADKASSRFLVFRAVPGESRFPAHILCASPRSCRRAEWWRDDGR